MYISGLSEVQNAIAIAAYVLPSNFLPLGCLARCLVPSFQSSFWVDYIKGNAHKYNISTLEQLFNSS